MIEIIRKIWVFRPKMIRGEIITLALILNFSIFSALAVFTALSSLAYVSTRTRGDILEVLPFLEAPLRKIAGTAPASLLILFLLTLKFIPTLFILGRWAWQEASEIEAGNQAASAQSNSPHLYIQRRSRSR